MSRVLFAGDLHLGHKRITKFRTEFKSAKEHDEFICDNLLAQIKKRDIIWLLGDIAFNYDSLLILKKFNIHKNINIILGNHDTDRELVISDWVNEGFTSIHSLYKYKEFWLSHPPMHPDELYGRRNIHGHMHKKIINDERYINVSLEQTNYNFTSLIDLRKKFTYL